MQHRLARAIGKADIAQFDARLGSISVPACRHRRARSPDCRQPPTACARRPVDCFRSMFNRARRLAGSVASRKAGHEGKELPGWRRARPRCSRRRSRQPATAKPPSISLSGFERLATRVILLALRSTTAILFVDAPLHGLFQREGLDRTDALQRFLHGFEDVGGAGELVVGETLGSASPACASPALPAALSEDPATTSADPASPSRRPG